jgi:hypothetical protein
MQKPDKGSYPQFFEGYVDNVEGEDVLKQWEQEASHTVKMIRGLDDEGKWTVRQVILHMMDVENVFAYRALCIARGQTADIPSFDHDAFAETSLSDLRTREEIAEDYLLMRINHLRQFGSFSNEDLNRVGSVSGNPFIARAIPFFQLGHERHHKSVLKDRYGIDMA